MAESEIDRAVTSPGKTPAQMKWLALIAVGLVSILTGAAAYTRLGGELTETGGLRVESDPPGSAVRVDGTERGRTPLTLALAAGRHDLVVSHATKSKQFIVTIAARAETIHHVSWPDEPAPVSTAGRVETGRIQIISDPPGGSISIDGHPSGSTPTAVDVAPGDHDVVVRSLGVAHRRTVRVDAGSTASLVISNNSSALSGWLTAPSAVALQIYENGRLIGTTDTERIMLPVGTHNLEFAASALEFRTRREVAITPGETTAVSIPLPRAPINVNALPWAEVWIDGVRAGETPIGNLMQTIGPHEIEFRHPQLGQKQVMVNVALGTPTRIAVDMRPQ